MLILVGVTVTTAINGGLFESARKAAIGTSFEKDKEQLTAAIATAYDVTTGIIKMDKLEEALGTGWTITGNDGGPYTVKSPDGNLFKVKTDGTITEKKELTTIEKYFLGENGEGRDVAEIFTDDEDENDRIVFAADSNLGIEKGQLKIAAEIRESHFVIKDSKDNSLYEIKFTEDGIDPEFGVVTLLENWDKNSKVGRFVEYNNIKYKIMYDDAEHGLQMISIEDQKYNNGKLYLGYLDNYINDWSKAEDLNKDKQISNFEKAVYSYNEAISTLNSACEGIVPAKEGIIENVRSVGSNPIKGKSNEENATTYTEEEFINKIKNSEFYGEGMEKGFSKSPDNHHTDDLYRMLFLDLFDSQSCFWLASRLNYDRECAMVGIFSSEGVSYDYKSTGGIFAPWGTISDSSAYLRPVITLTSNVQFTGGDGSTAEKAMTIVGTE